MQLRSRLFKLVELSLLFLIIACSGQERFFSVGSTPLPSDNNPATESSTGSIPSPTPIATPSLKCNSPAVALKSGQSTTFVFESGTAPNYVLEDSSGNKSTLGSFTVSSDGLSVTYVAPAAVSNATDLQLVASVTGDAAVQPAACSFSLIADGQIGIVDNGSDQGAVGKVVNIPVGTSILPDESALDALTPIQSILVPNFDYPRRAYTQPIPGTQPVAWYAIIFNAQLDVPTDGTYEFEVQSDDGSAFYLDGNLVVNLRNHATLTKTSAPIAVAAGKHAIRIDYGQWDGPNLGLQLFWQKADANGNFDPNGFVVVPPDHIFRPN